MQKKKAEINLLDQILGKIIDTVGGSKSEIFRIGEQCREDYEKLIEELKDIKLLIINVIDDGDKLEIKSRYARNRLSEVSGNFSNYSEREVREAYEVAQNLQIELSMNRQMEKEYRNRRDEIERRLVGLNETIERADHLVSQISVVLHYLVTDLKGIGSIVEEAKQKQDFGFRIIGAQEEERKRLSREIHDGPAQMMANVMMRSDLVERIYREHGINEAFQEIKNLKSMVRSALYEVRRIIYDLRPMALDDLGLIPTLKKYLQTTEEYHKNVLIQFRSVGKETRLPANYEVALFRLIQESVQNALKHAEARIISVSIELLRDHVNVLIKDDGKGFDTTVRKEESFGLIGMRERIELLDGDFKIESIIGNGTTIFIAIPIQTS